MTTEAGTGKLGTQSGGGVGEIGDGVIAHLDADSEYADLATEDYAALSIFLLLIIVVLLQVFTRYVLNDSFGWTEEIARYLLISMAFLGGAMAVRHRAHVAVRVFDSYASSGVSRWIDRSAELLSTAFYGYCACLSVQIGMALRTQRMTVIDVPISILYYVVAVGLALMFLRSIEVFVNDFRRVEVGAP